LSYHLVFAIGSFVITIILSLILFFFSGARNKTKAIIIIFVLIFLSIAIWYFARWMRGDDFVNQGNLEYEEVVESSEEMVLHGTWVGTFISEGRRIEYGLKIVIDEDNQVVATYFSDVTRENYIGHYRGFAKIDGENSVEIIYNDATQKPSGWVGEGAVFTGTLNRDILTGHFKFENILTGDAMLARAIVTVSYGHPFNFEVWGNTNIVQISNNSVILDVPLPSREDIRQNENQFILFGQGEEGDWWYRVDAQIGNDNSVIDAVNRYLNLIENRDCTIEMNYEMYNLDGVQLAIIDLTRMISEDAPRIDSTYVFAFEYEGEVVVVHINFAGNLMTQGRDHFW